MSTDQNHPIKDTNQPNESYFRWFIKWFGKNRKMQWLLFLLIAIFPLFILIYGVVVPVSQMSLLPVADSLLVQTKDSSTVTYKATKESKAQLHEILQKEIKIVVQNNRLSLARQDSIYLILDLSDSTISLEIKGVNVRKCPIVAMQKSNRIAASDPESLLHWVSEPFTLHSEISSIPKTPFLIVEAPKDTAEAARLPRKPLEPEKTFVHYTLLFSRDLVLEIEQTEPLRPEDVEIARRFKHQNDSILRRNMIKKLSNPIPEDSPIRIKLYLSEADARAIFRGMPHSRFAKLILKPF